MCIGKEHLIAYSRSFPYLSNGIINLFLLSPAVEWFIKVLGILILVMVLDLYPF
jgi:hypothetical protein